MAWVAVVLDDFLCFPTASCVLCMAGRWQPMMRSAVFTTLWRALQSEAEQLPYQAVMQPERMLLIQDSRFKMTLLIPREIKMQQYIHRGK